MIKMTKSELINALANRFTQLVHKDAELSVKAILDAMTNTLVNKERIEIRGFGSFIIKTRAKKTGRNISKNTAVIIPAHNIPAFKASKVFVNAVKAKVSV